MLIRQVVLIYNILAVLDGKAAVSCNPQSAIAGSNSRLRPVICGDSPIREALRIGSYAIATCEPRQIRKKAAVSSHCYVP